MKLLDNTVQQCFFLHTKLYPVHRTKGVYSISILLLKISVAQLTH